MDKSNSEVPELEIFAHVDLPADVDSERFAALAKDSVPLCLKSPGPHEPLLGEFSSVEISLISDEMIGEVHAEFMDDPTPTDVITFQHGEILVSVDTAMQSCTQHGNSVMRETLLYLIHGLLHLNGHEDVVEEERVAMHRIQESILDSVMPKSGGK